MADYAEKYAGLSNLKIRQLLGEVERLEPAAQVALRAEAERRGLKAALRRPVEANALLKNKPFKWWATAEDSSPSVLDAPQTKSSDIPSKSTKWLLILQSAYVLLIIGANMYVAWVIVNQPAVNGDLSDLITQFEQSYTKGDLYTGIAQIVGNVFIAWLLYSRRESGLTATLITATVVFMVFSATLFQTYHLGRIGFYRWYHYVGTVAYVTIQLSFVYLCTRSEVQRDYTVSDRLIRRSAISGVTAGVMLGAAILFI